ncbi:MAG: MerR family transcriptional regulator [Reichenbachiella sp.]|uniref:MerR family transcriptional regulator n=1 Tax=Reichenbachiella sp. TaxID=2184521 RepID=UPI003262DF98
MTKYSVKELSELAKVSVRTLHYYDQIDLLKPSFRSGKGYRFYERKQLLMLQQILFYKELGFSLQDIHSVISDPTFDLIDALESHKKELLKQSRNLQQLMHTVKKTLSELKNKKMMKDSEIYQGFTANEVNSMRQEVTDRWGAEQLKETEDRIRAMGKAGWEDTQQKGEEINQLLADLMDLSPEDLNVQEAITLHYRHMNLFYEVSKERYLGLGNMYVEDERFRAYYEKYRTGLAHFIKQAIEIYCEKSL